MSACNVGDLGSIPGSGRSPGEENGKNMECHFHDWASLVAQLAKNPSAMQETPVQFLVRKICWRRDRLPSPVFLGFPGGSNGKESACNVGDLG